MLPLGDSCSDRKDLLVSMGWDDRGAIGPGHETGPDNPDARSRIFTTLRRFAGDLICVPMLPCFRAVGMA